MTIKAESEVIIWLAFLSVGALVILNRWPSIVGVIL